MRILLSNSQAGPGRTVKQEQEEISHKQCTSLYSGLCTLKTALRARVTLNVKMGHCDNKIALRGVTLLDRHCTVRIGETPQVFS